MDPIYCYEMSRSLTRLIIKLAGQTYKSTFLSAVDDISLYYIVSLITRHTAPIPGQTHGQVCSNIQVLHCPGKTLASIFLQYLFNTIPMFWH